MYLGIDIGGTKTLVAALNAQGVIIEQKKLLTDLSYDDFIEDLKKTVASLENKDFTAGGVGIPAVRIDRKHGRALSFGNLPWQNVSIQHDIEKISHCPVVIDNDAKLAALSEAMLLKDKYKKVLYVTVSTGIGIGFVSDGIIDENIGDGGGRAILLEHRGKLMPWEDFAGGRAIYNRYGKRAKDIRDEDTWKTISRDLAKGFIHLISLVQPEVIVIGGGVGNYFERFGDLLKMDIEKYKIPLVSMPEIIKAQRPDEAVIYGCYDIAKQHYPHATDIK